MRNIEQVSAYDQLAATQPPRRLGGLRDAAYPPISNIQAQVMDVMRCPSWAGPSTITYTGTPAVGSLNMAHGTSTYISLPASAFTEQNKADAHLQNGPPSSSTAVNLRDCAPASGRAYCGDGALPFPGVSGSGSTLAVTKRGLKIGQLTDGPSRTLMITETREEAITAWYSGLASYAVAHLPSATASPVAQLPTGMNDTSPPYWKSDFPSINRGLISAGVGVAYQTTGMHGGPARTWGPSSRHDSVVVHGYADGHAEAMRDDITGNAYLALVTRAGREIPGDEN
jgi:hypothetical protein